MFSIQEKEQSIIGTVLFCNQEIEKLQKLKILNESIFNPNLYSFNMRACLNSINPLFESVQILPEEINAIKNNRNNFYSYFSQVYKYLDGYEQNIVKSLNESLSVDVKKVENPTQINIQTFKTDLKKIITELSKQNDLANLTPQILRIKLFAKKPIMIYGFDIVNNLSLRIELREKFNINVDELLSIIFDKSEKRILFITKLINNIVCYDLSEDKLDYYSKFEILDTKATTFDNNYLRTLKELIHNNIVELHANIDFSDAKFKFKDNLYSDVKIHQQIAQQNNQNNPTNTGFVRK